MKRVKLTKEEAAKLLMFRKDRGLRRKKIVNELGINPSTLLFYEKAELTIPMNVWKELEKIYETSFEGMGEIIESKVLRGGNLKKVLKKVIMKTYPNTQISEAQKERESKLKNKLEVNKLLKSLNDFLYE